MVADERSLDAKLEKLVARRADMTVAVTEELAEDFRRRLGVPTVTIPNAWDPEAEEDLDPQEGLTAKGWRAGAL